MYFPSICRGWQVKISLLFLNAQKRKNFLNLCFGWENAEQRQVFVETATPPKFRAWRTTEKRFLPLIYADER